MLVKIKDFNSQHLYMSVKERFVWLLDSHEISREKFGRQAGYNPNTITSFVSGKTKYPRQDFFEAVKKVFPYVNLNWFIVGEGEKWVSAPPEGIDPEWAGPGKIEEGATPSEKKLLAESTPQELAQAESLVTKLLLREIKRMRDDMKDSNPGLVDKYGLDELLEDVE